MPGIQRAAATSSAASSGVVRLVLLAVLVVQRYLVLDSAQSLEGSKRRVCAESSKLASCHSSSFLSLLCNGFECVQEADNINGAIENGTEKSHAPGLRFT